MCCRFDGGSTNALVHRGLQTQLNIKNTCRSSKKIQVRVTWCLKFHYKVNSERSAFPHHTCISCTLDHGDIVIHNIHLDIFKSQQKHFMNSNLTDLKINQEKTTRVSHWDTTMSKIKGNIYIVSYQADNIRSHITVVDAVTSQNHSKEHEGENSRQHAEAQNIRVKQQ